MFFKRMLYKQTRIKKLNRPVLSEMNNETITIVESKLAKTEVEKMIGLFYK